MYNATQYAQNYRPPMVRAQMGKVSDLSLGDWAMLAGGAIVTGSGLNAVVGGLPSKTKKVNFVALLVGTVVTLVGGTAFVAEFKKLVA